MSRFFHFFQPSLVSRLVLAQIAIAALTWLALAFYIAHDLSVEAAQSEAAQMRLGAALILPLAQGLAGQPELLRQTLQRVDAYQRGQLTNPDGKLLLLPPRLYLWQDGQLIYRSVDAEPGFQVERTKETFDVSINNSNWQAYAEDSANGRSRFAIVTPVSAAAAGLAPWSRSWIFLPLLVSLPFLVIPAWWSVRFALRPLARLSAELDGREVGDLSALIFVPRHRELKPLSTATDRLLQKLRLLRERERNFLADAAHELRTPIAAIQVNAEVLRQRDLPDKDREVLDGLVGSSNRATRLVVQLLALTRSNAAPTLQTVAIVNMAALVQDALALLEPLAKAKMVELDLISFSKINVKGDREALFAMVENVVGNAIKYSPVGGTVHVRIRCKFGLVRVTVADEGNGIPTALRTRVFDRFFRVAGQTEPGSGLGLAIAKSAANFHQANLKVLSARNNSGLTVQFSMRTCADQQNHQRTMAKPGRMPNAANR